MDASAPTSADTAVPSSPQTKITSVPESTAVRVCAPPGSEWVVFQPLRGRPAGM